MARMQFIAHKFSTEWNTKQKNKQTNAPFITPH